ncbi:MAG: hypothetical protein HQ582_13290, partial [Planctomycetes bacterium]|nr:hypothetical protein [Planctomycetota bacterium]
MSQPNLSPPRLWSLTVLGCGLLLAGIAYPGFGQVVIVDLPSDGPPTTPQLNWLAATNVADTPNSPPQPLETSVDEDAAYGCCAPADAGCADCANGCGRGGSKAAKAAAKSHKVLFYDNDFSYLLDPCYSDCYLGDSFKRLSAGHCTTLDIGGQFRMRHHSERNHRRLGLTGNDDDFLLYRTRLYANAEIGDGLRVYGEMIDAVS